MRKLPVPSAALRAITLRAITLRAITLVLFSVLAIGCVQGKPQILSTDVKLLRVQGPAGLFAERLSLFVLATDSDGPADYRSIALTEDDSGLSWTVGPESAMVTMKGKDRWIGTNAIAWAGDGSFPEGSYSIVFTDLAGNESLKTFELARPSFPETAPVRFYTEDTKWYLERNSTRGDFTREWLFLLDGQSRILQTWKVPEGDSRAEGTIESLQMMALQAVSVQCYAENASGTAGVLLTPVDLR